MNSSTLIIIIVAVIFLVGGIFFFNSQKSPSSDTAMQPDQVTMQEDPSTISEQEESQMSGGSGYKIYNATILEETKDKKRVLYFFANWCPTCIPADKDFQANENQIPDDVVVIRVNYNDPDTDEEEKELARQYGVTYQHTFVQIDGEGNVVTKWNGGQVEELLTNLK